MWWKLTLTTSLARSLMKLNLYKIHSHSRYNINHKFAFNTDDFHKYNKYLQKTYYIG